MKVERNSMLAALMRRETVLSVFVFTTVVSTLLSDFGVAGENTWIKLLSVVVFPLLAWFTHKRYLLATWCTILLLIVTGTEYIYEGFMTLRHGMDESFAMLIIKTLVGIYLTWGALLIHRERHVRD